MRQLLHALLLFPLLAGAQPPPGYYDATYQLSGEALRVALYDIIRAHTVVPNNQIWAAFELSDARLDGTVWDMYSDVPNGTPPYIYQFGEDQCGNYDSEGDCFNREHSFPQSWYGSGAPMSTDLFHLYPADAWVNQQRGNWPFGTVAVASWTSMNGGKRGPCSWPGCSGTVFEPIDAYKGDFARSFFYMLTRYLPQLASWDTPMMDGGDFSAWAEDMLLAWHEQDPVSEKETDRNNAVFTLQGNRNPFIDQPQWAHFIWGPTASIAEDQASAIRMWHSNSTLYLRADHRMSGENLRIMDPAGRLIMEIPLNDASAEIVLELPSGIYMAALYGSGSYQVLRFVQ
jgi:endonuclease I